MDIGPEQEPFIAEPLRDPFRREQPEREPPERLPEREPQPEGEPVEARFAAGVAYYRPLDPREGNDWRELGEVVSIEFGFE